MTVTSKGFVAGVMKFTRLLLINRCRRKSKNACNSPVLFLRELISCKFGKNCHHCLKRIWQLGSYLKVMSMRSCKTLPEC